MHRQRAIPHFDQNGVLKLALEDRIGEEFPGGRVSLRPLLTPTSTEERAPPSGIDSDPHRWSFDMNARAIFFASCANLLLATGLAQAGPCNTASKDAGSGPTPGHTAQTTGTASPRDEHPPTDTMNKASGDVAASSQDAQLQMQGQPTVSQEAQGAKPKAENNDC